MPPLRNMALVKPMKTERTHEENQERAYIAASRRNDRSLEARVESARRASEIHKRRTGRSLRVSEQDVMNEEMYEEEDDDLPLQYRRLTANLQTGSFEFNRKLAAYLTHNVAVRSALNQAINESYAQQYPNAQQQQQFPQNQNTIFPSPLSTSNLAGPAPTFTQSPQGTPTSPHPYRQTPYPMPGTPGFRGQPHKRVNSAVATAQDFGTAQNYSNPQMDGSVAANLRRMSMPASTGAKPEGLAEMSRDSATSVASSPRVPTKQESMVTSPIMGNMGPPSWQQQQQQQQPQQQQQHQQGPQQPSFFDFQQTNMSPLTMTLPPDAQQLLGATLPPDDPFSNILLGGNHPNQFFAMNDYMNNDYLHTAGMHTTLAPNAHGNQDVKAANSSDTQLLDEANNSNLNPTDFKGVHYNTTPPGEHSFDAWINDTWNTENT